MEEFLLEPVMDEEFGDVSSETRVLRLDEEQHFGVDAQAAGRRVAVTFGAGAGADPLAVFERRRTEDRRVESRSAEHPAKTKRPDHFYSDDPARHLASCGRIEFVSLKPPVGP